MSNDGVTIAKIKTAYGLAIKQCSEIVDNIPCRWSNKHAPLVSSYIAGDVKSNHGLFPVYLSILRESSGKCGSREIKALSELAEMTALPNFIENMFSSLDTLDESTDGKRAERLATSREQYASRWVSAGYTKRDLAKEVFLLNCTCNRDEVIRYCYSQRWRFKKEVDGLFQCDVDRVIREHEVQQAPQPAPAQQPVQEQAEGVKTHTNNTHIIFVEKSYYIGKIPKTIREAMRKADPPFPDCIIALILRNNCDLKPTEIGRLLYSGKKETPVESTYLRCGNKLLEEARNIEICDMPA